jgi:putative DNA base modification enzyme with NMAD domain
MSNVYFYVVDRDFGFAPNPFHGYCTLATCMAQIRARAQKGDWVIGMGGRRLKATGRCIYAMRVTDAVTFNSYWQASAYSDKRPVRNGSRKMMVGDNIYHRDLQSAWHQADSHHSNPDGTPNLDNIANDTKADRVLISTEFFYFGRNAPTVPPGVLEPLGYKNGRNYRLYSESNSKVFLDWLVTSFGHEVNLILADPFDFASSNKRYSVVNNKIT